MQEVLLSAIRYLMAKKKLILLNVSSLIIGILIILFSVFIYNTETNLVADVSFYSMILLGFSLLINFFLLNIGIFYSRLVDFKLKIALGSNTNRVFIQILLEGVIQIFLAIVVSLVLADAIFNLIINPVNGAFSILIFFKNDLFYIKVSIWIALALGSLLLLRKNMGIPQSITINKNPIKKYRILSKYLIIVQLFLFNSIGISAILNWSSMTVLIFTVIILSLAAIFISLIIYINYRTRWENSCKYIYGQTVEERKNVDLCNKTTLFLIYSCFLTIFIDTILYNLKYSVNWNHHMGIIILLAINILFAFSGKIICLHMVLK
jgi:hypothetical protein